jgi:hypothetical protein
LEPGLSLERHAFLTDGPVHIGESIDEAGIGAQGTPLDLIDPVRLAHLLDSVLTQGQLHQKHWWIGES